MYTIFIEYRIQSERWNQYQIYIPYLKETMKNIYPNSIHRVLISKEEPRQVVETIETDQLEWVEHIRTLRGEANNFLHDLDSHIEGGRSKLKFWVFYAV